MDNFIVPLFAFLLLIGFVIGIVGLAASGDARWAFLIVPTAWILYRGAKNL